jgi:lipopolysaccharide biosynthesis glycosyltransferase
MAMAVTLRSIVDNHRGPTRLEFAVFAHGIRNFKRRRIMRSLAGTGASVRWVDEVDDQRLRRIRYGLDYPMPTYYRLLLGELLPDRSRAIYTDVDVVFEDDIETLWSMGMQDSHYVLAVLEATMWTLGRSKGLQRAIAARGLSPDTPFPSNGLMVINLDKWREDRIADRSLEFIEREAEGRFRDMDALAVLFNGRWGEIEPRWNCPHPVFHNAPETLPYSPQDFRRAHDNPAVVHYSSRPKPWEAGCKHPLAHLFYKYLDRTAWRGWRNTNWRRGLRRGSLELERLARRLGAERLGARVPRLVQYVID